MRQTNKHVHQLGLQIAEIEGSDVDGLFDASTSVQGRSRGEGDECPHIGPSARGKSFTRLSRSSPNETQEVLRGSRRGCGFLLVTGALLLGANSY